MTRKICLTLAAIATFTYPLRWAGFPMENFAQSAIIFTCLSLEILVINLEL